MNMSKIYKTSQIFTAITTSTTKKNDLIETTPNATIQPLKSFITENMLKPTFYKILHQLYNFTTPEETNSYRLKLMEKMRNQQMFTTTISQKKQRTKNLDCQNGGLLIDKICICLNSFYGIECEIVPEITTTTATTTNKFLERIKPQQLNLVNESKIGVKRQRLNSNDFTIITINRHGRGGNKIFIKFIYFRFFKTF